MTARDTITEALWNGGHLHDRLGDAADATIAAIRRMPPDELAELRPDIATEFYILREQAATRGQYLLTTLRAHQAEQENRP